MTDQPENADTSVNATADPDPALAFDEVFAAELKAIGRTGQNDALVGLALSGGGIRSATFNLGVLQALAAEGLLKRFDYLSSVSGGGYIGCWLTALIYRRAQAQVERESVTAGHPLTATQIRSAAEKGLDDASGELVQLPEPESISHLREFSNYLTPRPGLFSLDSLSWVTLYLSKLVLNVALVISFIAVLILMVWFTIAAWMILHSAAQQLAVLYGIMVLTAGLIVVSLFVIGINQATPRSEAPLGRLTRLCTTPGITNLILLPAAIASWLTSIWLDILLFDQWPSVRKILGKVVPTDVLGVTQGILFALIIGVLFMFYWYVAMTAGTALQRRWYRAIVGHDPRRGEPPPYYWQSANTPTRSTLPFVAISGIVCGLILYRMSLLTHTVCSSSTVSTCWLAAWLGPPIVALIYAITIVLNIGLAGQQFSDLEHEWWARVGAWWLVGSVAWLIVFGLVLLGPPLMAEAPSYLSGLVSLSWIISTIGGVLVGRSAASGTGGNAWLNRIVQYVPLVVGPGLVVITTSLLELAAFGYVPRDDKQSIGVYLSSQVSRFATGGHGRELITLIVLATFAYILFNQSNVNKHSLHSPYRIRLARCYLAASRRRRQRDESMDPFNGFGYGDELTLAQLASAPAGQSLNAAGNGVVAQRPYPIINSALNMVAGTRKQWQQRKAASFVFAPLFCGYEFAEEQVDSNSCPVHSAYRATPKYMGQYGGVFMSTAMAISGAAASPNMGYHSSPAVTFLLAVANARLGRWCPNPRHSKVADVVDPPRGVKYPIMELFGLTTSSSEFVYLSDGGHFENLGLYELVRRGCRTIVVCDLGSDPKYAFNDIGNAIRKCYVDFGATIDINLSRLVPDGATGRSEKPFAIGTIRYRSETHDGQQKFGDLIVIKPSITHHSSADLLNFKQIEPDFPQVTTADQWFAEDQFESYRKLGRECAALMLKDAKARAILGLASPT